jgi:hypothetical protein
VSPAQANKKLLYATANQVLVLIIGVFAPFGFVVITRLVRLGPPLMAKQILSVSDSQDSVSTPLCERATVIVLRQRNTDRERRCT